MLMTNKKRAPLMPTFNNNFTYYALSIHANTRILQYLSTFSAFTYKYTYFEQNASKFDATFYFGKHVKMSST